MKRADAFMLGMTTFIAANCASYFVRSGAPYVTGWGSRPGVHGLYEGIGFPLRSFGISFGSFGPFFCWNWTNWLGNVVVAAAVSYVLSARFANRLPPLWLGQSSAFRYSLRGLLGCMTTACVLLGIAMLSRPWGILVRNGVCLAVPIFVYGWWFYRRQLGWTRLTVAALGLTLMTLAIDLRYQEPALEIGSIARAILPIGADWGAGPERDGINEPGSAEHCSMVSD
jgi:hypothetical protein